MVQTLKRTIASICLAALVASFALVAPAHAGTYADVPADHWAYAAVEKLAADGVIVKRTNFYPGDPVNRAQVVKLVVESTNLAKETPTSDPFPDVPKDAWYGTYVATAVKHGIVAGYPDGKFRPDQTINRAEASKIVHKAFGFAENTVNGPHFTDVKINDWFYKYVETLYNNSVVKGKSAGIYSPESTLNRAEMAVMIYRAQNPTPVATPEPTTTPTASADPTASPTATPDVQSKAGITVTRSTATAAAGTVPKAASSVAYLSVDFKAGAEDDVTINSLKFKRNGVGAASDFSNVYLYDGATRLTSGRSVSTDSGIVEFPNLRIKVDKATTKTLTLRADIADTTAAENNESYFTVESADAVGSNATAVNGTFPVMGNTLRIGSTSAGTLTISKNGTPPTPTIGSTQAEIARFKLEASSEDLKLYRIALIHSGTVNRSDLTNLKLYQGSTLLAETDGLDSSDLMHFNLGDDPYTIGDGNSKIFTVKADIAGKADETTKIYLDEDTDIYAVGQKYQYGSQVTSTYTSSDPTELTLEGGQVTLSYVGPSAANYSQDSKDKIFLRFNLTSQRDIEVKKLQVKLESVASGADSDADDNDLYHDTNSEGNLKDIRIVEIKDDGSRSTLMGPQELTAVSGSSSSDTSQTISYTDSFYVSAGETKKMAVTADINDNATANDQFRATLLQVSASEGIKDTVTNKYVDDIVPSAAMQGNSMTITTASLDVTLSTTPAKDTVVKGTKNVNLVGFLFKAGETDDVTITDLSMKFVVENGEGGSLGWTAGVDTDGSSTARAADLIESVDIYEGDTKLNSSSETPNRTTGVVTYSGLNWTIPKGTTKKLVVQIDISSNGPYGGASDLISAIIDSAAYVTAEDEDGDAITAGIGSNGPNSNSGNWATSSPNVYVTISSGGTIAVSAPAEQISDQVVLHNTNNIKVAKFKVKATDEDYEIERLTLGSVGTGGDDAIKSLTIKYPSAQGDVEATESATSGDTRFTFDNLGFIVPKDDENVYFEVYANTQEIVSDGSLADTGDQVKVRWYGTTSSTYFKAKGEGSQSYTYNSGSAIDSNIAYVRKSIPTVTYVGTNPGTIEYTSTAEVLRFKVTADDSGNVGLYKIVFDVSINGLTDNTSDGYKKADGWKIYDTTDLSTTLDTATYDSSADTVTFTFSSGKEVPAGSTGKTYKVVAPIKQDAVEASDATLAIKIAEDGSAASAAGAVATAVSGNFIWSDLSLGSMSVTDADWTNGYKVTIPTSNFIIN